MRRDEGGVSPIIGAIIVLAILTITLVYFNAYRVPLEGEGLDRTFVEEGARAMQSLQSELRVGADQTPLPLVQANLPITPPRPEAGLMAGFVVTPATGGATARFNATGPKITVFHETAGGGIVYDLGGPGTGPGAEAGIPLGNLSLDAQPAYLRRVVHVLEGGALFRGDVRSQGTYWAPVLSTGLEMTSTKAALRIVRLTGDDTEVAGPRSARVTLEHEASTASPPPELAARRVTIVVETARPGAWKSLLTENLGVVPACGAGTPTATCVTETATRLKLVLVGPSGGTAADLKLTTQLTAYRVRLN
ncbi:MAG TPA: hypothetical protein VNZ52_01480 [Candidatus Thermoplasmatota archaeon]|nr:hypothetical protein [Candidatus Thermoplasmatota archaeon]